MTTQLPAYFKEYFDEKFKGVTAEIQEVKDDIAELKKNVADSDSRINKLWMAILVVVLVLSVHFGQTEGDALKSIFSLL